MLGQEQLPRLQAVSLDGRILFFTLTLTLLTGVLFGLAPALQAGQLNLNEVLKEGGRSGGTSRRQRRLRDALVIAEVALALVLLVGAGLLMRSFWKLQQTNSGFNSGAGVDCQSGVAACALQRSVQGLRCFSNNCSKGWVPCPNAQAVGLTSDLPWTGYDENCGVRHRRQNLPA